MKDRKLTKIDLVFENCEVATLTPEMFKGLIIGGIYTDYWINCFQYQGGETRVYQKCRDFSVFINEDGLKAPTSGTGVKLNKRLEAYQDITSISLKFEGWDEEHIQLPWGDEDYTNTKQKNTAKEDGVFIEIKS